MPTNKNAVIRYQKLDELLSDRHHHYTMEEITDKVNELPYRFRLRGGNSTLS